MLRPTLANCLVYSATGVIVTIFLAISAVGIGYLGLLLYYLRLV